MKIILLVFLFATVFAYQCPNDCYVHEKSSHHLRGLSGQEIGKLVGLVEQTSQLESIFQNINVVRPVGSENHGIVRKYIETYLNNLNWKVTEDKFTMDTVIGSTTFTNIIATHNISKPRRLILACHYESLNIQGFYGSIDSAMPCSIILDVVRILQPLLDNNMFDVTLQLVFFDGEEAFRSWSQYDSLYGSRHLAKLWENERDICGCSYLSSIDSLILLDLIGSSSQKFVNFQYNDLKLYESLHKIERRITFQRQQSGNQLFNLITTGNSVEDDHIPFIQKGVSVVHLIPLPFPHQWHDLSDNANNIDWTTSRKTNMIIVTFIVEYFHLSNYFDLSLPLFSPPQSPQQYPSRSDSSPTNGK